MKPTYRTIGDHSETIQIDYDPSRITYEDLLEVFWSAHDPTRRNWSRQYRSDIFTHDEEQRAIAAESKARQGRRRGGKIRTAIEPFGRFTMAEDYHQKYTLRQYPEIMTELETLYPSFPGLRDSTAAARLNGYLSSYGSLEEFEREEPRLTLTPVLAGTIRDLLKERRPEGR